MNNFFVEYLGSDGLRITESHNRYMEKCHYFVARAQKYKSERARRKASAIHSPFTGYESRDDDDKQIFEVRCDDERVYRESFDYTHFGHDNKQDIFENYFPRTKCIRIVRDLSESRRLGCEVRYPVGQSWFLRFRTLSKFVQAVRMTILRLRLEKRLDVLKHLTPEIVKEFEPEEEVMYVEEEEELEFFAKACPIMCTD